MKDWREKLKEAKRTLGKATPPADEEEKAAGMSFQPPQSWLEKAEVQRKVANAGQANDSATDKPTHRPRVILRTNKSRTHTLTSGQEPTASAGSEPSCAATVPPPTFKPRLEPGRAMHLPDWASQGKSLQPLARGEPPDISMIVRIGLDFGTAFTKVAVRAGRDTFVVDWSDVTGDESPASRHVVPGLVIRRWDGEYSWSRSGKSDVRGNLKLPLIEDPGATRCPVDTIAFLALVIRCARASLYRHPDLGRKLAGRSLKWELNIGCPTEPHEDKRIVALFQRVAQTAWRLAASDRVHERDILAAWETGSDSLAGLEASPAVVPEFVAQIAGYLKSPRVGEGLHALVDVGAATLDVATFNVVNPHGQESPRIPIFFSAVRPLGTHYLNYARHSGLHLNLEWDDAASLERASDFASRHRRLPSEVRDIDATFIQTVVGCVVQALESTRTNNRGHGGKPDKNGRYARGTAWSDGLPIFITGGGAESEPYRDAMRQIEAAIKLKLRANTEFRFVELQAENTSFTYGVEDAAGRTTVAIGLTEDSESIGKIVPHSQLEAITFRPKRLPEHGEMYSKR